MPRTPEVSSLRCLAGPRLPALAASICATLVLSAPAETQTLFTDVTQEAIASPLFGARSTAWGDWNNDGWPDLFGTESLLSRSRVFLLTSDGHGHFGDLVSTIRADIAAPSHYGGGAIYGDYDNDGDLDVYVPVGGWKRYQMNMLLRNDRGTFTDVAAEANLTNILPTDNAVWLDFDRDGHLDLFEQNLIDNAGPGVGNRLYRNQGNGTYSDVTEKAGLAVRVQRNRGGSNGGLAAGDFNGDGWPDLYVGVWDGRNRLFLNNTMGGFRDATTGEIGDEGEAFGVAVGDINNDGLLDIFQAAGGGTHAGQRSLMLQNLGEGQFLDITDGAGISGLDENTLGVGLADVDNDGDLDLVTASPPGLFLNAGQATFEDATSGSGIGDVSLTVSFADYDLDGSLDVFFGADDAYNPTRIGGLYRNTANANHWLRVELAGSQSNRNGIGSLLKGIAGDLRQTRQILGGKGYDQDELVAHFGLGQRTQMDTLEIRWPSGQVDALANIPADQKIRIFEGNETYHVVEPTTWEGTLVETDTLVVGSSVDLVATVRPALYEPDAEITRVVADLSAIGGPEDEPLRDVGDGAYVLETIVPEVVGPGRVAELAVMIDQSTSLGPYWVRLSKGVVVLPGSDLVLYDEHVAPGWEISTERVTEHNPAQTNVVGIGSVAWAVQAEEHRTGWHLSLSTLDTLSLVGYDTLSFCFHPGDVTPPSRPWLRVRPQPGGDVYVLGGSSDAMDLERKEWQRVVVPVSEPKFGEELAGLRFSGYFGGTFYLDDIRLIAEKSGQHPGTAVTEERSASLPAAFTLSQNYPNPFNSSTTIRFSLPQQQDVHLTIYNLAGQQAVTLAHGQREAGTYSLHWDGRDDDGRLLASGVYLYRLQTSEQTETRKLLLLR